MPATRLNPLCEKKSIDAAPGTPAVARGAATRRFTARVGTAAPLSGTRSSRITSSPRRRTTRTCGCAARPSVAATASAPGAPAGPATEPNAGPAPPSLPAAVTTSVFRSSAPCTACASGPSVNAAYGSVTPTSATRTASCSSPSPFGSTARSSPAISWSLRPYTSSRPSAAACQPATRIGRIVDAGAMPRRPSGPFEPARMPASSVPCCSICERSSGFARAEASESRSRTSMPGSTWPWRYGCPRSTPVSRSAIVTPLPSKPGTPTSGRWPLLTPYECDWSCEAETDAGNVARTG